MNPIIFNFQRHKAILQLLRSTTSPSPSSPRCYPHLLQPNFSSNFSTTTSGKHSFTVSYLISNLGLSSESALKASKRVHFESSQKPDSVIAFLRNNGFANSQIQSIISKAPWLLLYHPDKTILPKFEFLLSKGASASDIVLMVTKNPRILQRSLKNHIVTSYELIKSVLQSDERTIACLKIYPLLLFNSEFQNNVKLLRDIGVSDSNIAKLLGMCLSLLCSSDFGVTVEEVKQLGFDPSKTTFILALAAKKSLSKSRWDEKVDTFKKWGWSEETVLEVFRRQPNCMLKSTDKINAVMNYWVNQLGWDPLALVRGSEILGLSLEKRIIPRASVLQYLLSKGLRGKSASLLSPFIYSEELFLEKFVKRFKEETPQLLELYEEKMHLQDKLQEGAT